MTEPARLVRSRGAEPPATGLPGWIYHDPEFFAVEMERVIRPSWQIVCHASEIDGPGAWRTLDLLGESLLVMRGDDGEIRAFANVCRHRGARLVDSGQGCARRLTCPYHGWTYANDGRLIGLPHEATYPELDRKNLGLVAIACETWHGFVFVRMQGKGPTVAEMMAPQETEIAQYRLDELRPLGRTTIRPRTVNWKTIADNYSDGMHITIAHPGLTRLFGGDYGIEAGAHVDRMWGELAGHPSANLSERAYQTLLPRDAGRRWLYFKLWPNLAFDLYPDQIDFMHFVPVSATETLIREISYALPDDRREMKAARYLNWRINRRVNEEDTDLVSRVQQGMASSFYSPGPLGLDEVCLRSFAERMRRLIPESICEAPPPPGWSRRPAA